jgi:uncharacterized protein YegP (UPF0339 family)
MRREDASDRRHFVLPRWREAANVHFRRLGESALPSDGALLQVLSVRGSPEPGVHAPCKFEIYREDEVRLSATRFSGGDWHWRLKDASGKLLLDAGGYDTEAECQDAVHLLQAEAALAVPPDRA